MTDNEMADADERAQLQDEIARLRGMVHDDAMMLGEQGREIERLTAYANRLTAYANHERSLGAERPMIELTQAKQEIERLRAALREIAVADSSLGWSIARAALEGK